jgi:hypothetical protein
MTAPIAPPMSGATQNSYSWQIAQPPANNAGPVLRAGLTKALVTGILTILISVMKKPMAISARLAGARSSMVPGITTRRNRVDSIE